MDRHLGGRIRRRASGYCEREIVETLILLQLAGGESVGDLRLLAEDQGFCEVMERVALAGLRRGERRRVVRRRRRQGRSLIPSASAVFRFLNGFHDEALVEGREAGRAWVPEKAPALDGLWSVNRDLLAAAQRRSPERAATLDVDATLVKTYKRDALASYKGFRAYQPLNVWWAEQQLVVLSEFRDGNVPAQSGYLRVLEEALDHLPKGVERVRLRSDSAGYQWGLLKYCERGKNGRFGRIEFAVGADVSFKLRSAIAEVGSADWKELAPRKGEVRRGPKQEWAEVCFVPNAAATSLNGEYRFLVVREPLVQQVLPEIGEQLDLPFPTMELGHVRYKITAVVTNLDWAGDEVIHWYRERCGKSEEAHATMKTDLAGGRMPSGKLGANAAWWAVMILALNLNEIMKRQVLARVEGARRWARARMKTLRFHLVNIAARVVRHQRRLILRISAGHPSLPILIAIRERILELATPPPG